MAQLPGVWDYSEDFTNPLNQVRLLCGDTERPQGLLTDREITWLLSQQSNVFLAAALACDLICAKLAKRPDISLAGQSASLSARVGFYQKVAERLRREAAQGMGVTPGPGPGPVAGARALLVLEDRALQDATGVIPAFWRDQFGYPGAQDATRDADEEG